MVREIISTMGFKFIGKNKIVIGGAILCCLIMVVFPEVTATASKEAINLWLNSIVPTLLPFFIVANFLKRPVSSIESHQRFIPLPWPFYRVILWERELLATIIETG